MNRLRILLPNDRCPGVNLTVTALSAETILLYLSGLSRFWIFQTRDNVEVSEHRYIGAQP